MEPLLQFRILKEMKECIIEQELIWNVKIKK